MGTLIFFNVYTYFREEIIEISSKYLILSIGEIFVVQVLSNNSYKYDNMDKSFKT